MIILICIFIYHDDLHPHHYDPDLDKGGNHLEETLPKTNQQQQEEQHKEED